MEVIKFIMKKLLLLLFFIAITISCQTNRKTKKHLEKELRANMSIHVKGYIGSVYYFSDTSDRNLRVLFLNDTLIEISNTSIINTPYHNAHLDVKCKYVYKSINLTELLIIRSLNGCKLPQNPEISYLKPFDFRHFTIDEKAIQYIFSDITNDTIRFSSKLEKLQIREFCFDKIINK